MDVEYSQLLTNTPIYLQGIGFVKNPTLHDIFDDRIMGYSNFEFIKKFLYIDMNTFLKITNQEVVYKQLSNSEKEIYTLFRFMVVTPQTKEIIDNLLSFFIYGRYEFNKANLTYKIYDIDNQTVGFITNENYNDFIHCIMQICCLKVPTQKTSEKYKNQKAKEFYESFQKKKDENLKQQQKNEGDSSQELPFLISKYCSWNTSGINILNIWELTLFQFYDQFKELNYQKQVRMSDDIYTHSLTFKEATQYDTQTWLKK
jgi:hypothetical protein